MSRKGREKEKGLDKKSQNPYSKVVELMKPIISQPHTKAHKYVQDVHRWPSFGAVVFIV